MGQKQTALYGNTHNLLTKIFNEMVKGSLPGSVFETPKFFIDPTTFTTKEKIDVGGKGKTSTNIRGRYSQYTPELRAKIGKFALKHGNAAAVRHFQAELGHEIPESTIRGMQDKYQVLSDQVPSTK